MPTSNESGRFWVCPECRRHVPARKDACLCGFDRTTVPVRMREVSASHAPAVREQRSFVGVAWPFIVIAGLIGYIAYGRLTSGASAPPPSPPVVAAYATPIPLSDEVRAALDEASAGPEVLRPAEIDSSAPSQGAAPAPQVIRIEVPQQQPLQFQQPQAGADASQQQEMAARQEEIHWRTQFSTLSARVHGAKAAYKNQVCQEARGGIPVSGIRDTRGEYLAARTELEALEGAARVAGIPPGWFRVNWGEFPSPEDPSGRYNPAGLARKWDCGNVTSWGQ